MSIFNSFRVIEIVMQI